MSRRLILHIGTPKTGSTTTQILLTHNRKALRKRGICYAQTGGGNNHISLAFAFWPQAELKNKGEGPLWNERDLARATKEPCELLRREMTELSPEVSLVIVSSEAFTNVSDPESIGRLRALVAPFFDDIEILVYMRRQDGHATSQLLPVAAPWLAQAARIGDMEGQPGRLLLRLRPVAQALGKKSSARRRSSHASSSATRTRAGTWLKISSPPPG